MSVRYLGSITSIRHISNPSSFPALSNAIMNCNGSKTESNLMYHLNFKGINQNDIL